MVSGKSDSAHGEKEVRSPAKYRMARDVMDVATPVAVGSVDAMNVEREEDAMLDAVDCALYMMSSSGIILSEVGAAVGI